MIVFLRNTFIVMVLVILTFMVFKVGVFGLAPNDKSDGECTGQETAGRCIDKCADGSIPLGFDPITKVAQCKTPPPAETTTSQNVPDTELPQFQVDNSVDNVENFTGK